MVAGLQVVFTVGVISATGDSPYNNIFICAASVLMTFHSLIYIAFKNRVSLWNELNADMVSALMNMVFLPFSLNKKYFTFLKVGINFVFTLVQTLINNLLLKYTNNKSKVMFFVLFYKMKK